MGKIVFLNGKFLFSKEARVSVLAPGFLSGLGLFETMRSYNGRIVYLDEHLRRIKGSVKLMGMGLPFSVNKLKELIRAVVLINGIRDAYVRLTLWRSEKGTDILLVAKKYKPYAQQKYIKGFRAIISSLRQSESSLLARMKTTSRLLYQFSLKEAQDRGFDEAIILNNRGYLTEASRSNLFLVKDRALFTPSLSCGCLDGITRRVVFALAKKANIKIYEGNLTPQDLCQADETFLTNSLIGVIPLVSLERQPIRGALRGKTTAYFIKRYNSLLKYGT